MRGNRWTGRNSCDTIRKRDYVAYVVSVLLFGRITYSVSRARKKSFGAPFTSPVSFNRALLLSGAFRVWEKKSKRLSPSAAVLVVVASPKKSLVSFTRWRRHPPTKTRASEPPDRRRRRSASVPGRRLLLRRSPLRLPSLDPCPPPPALPRTPVFCLSSFFRFHSGTVALTVACAASGLAKTPKNRWIPGLSRMNPA